MGWPAWWNVWKYVRSSTGWSIKPESFQFISWRPPRLSKYRKRCIYWRHIHCLSVECWRSGINVGEPNRFAKFNPWAGKLLYAVAYVVNPTKTKVLVFNERFVCGDNRYFTFNKNKVPTSNTYNYLGVIFSNADDHFGENYENTHGKVLRAIYAARNLAHNAIGPDVAPTVLFKIFDTQIQPIIDYNSEVLWSQRETSVRVLTNCIFKVCAWCKCPDIKPGNFWWNGTISSIRETRETGSRLLGEINYIIPNKSPAHCIWWTLPSQYYRQYDLVHSCRRFININRFRKYLGGQMIPVSAFHVDQLKSRFKTELERHYTKKWLQEINDREQNPILRTYAIFKENHCLETYIQCLSVKNISKQSLVSGSVPTDLALNWGDTINRVYQWNKDCVISVTNVI